MYNFWSQNTKYWYHLSSVDMKSGLYYGSLKTDGWYSNQLIVRVLNMSLDCHSASEVSLMDMGKSVNV